ncbi:hypothetical protein KIS4809_5162 [Bacillus sp. ZZV12-4809]|nr:hypothetical protein KIS4809_5162 [Bacillus sp. ZZV12-4809]
MGNHVFYKWEIIKKGIELFHALNYDCVGTQKGSRLSE